METLKEAQEHVRENFEKGTKCPCCGQFVKLYKYSFHKGMARSLYLIDMAHKKNLTDDEGFIHVENYFVEIGVKIKGSHGKLKCWGLLEQRPNTDKKKHKSGYWRITDKGRDLLDGKIKVPKKALLFNNMTIGFDGEDISLTDCLGEHFDYEKLMKGE